MYLFTSIAYHFDLPMLATRVGGLEEMVIDNETGIIIPSPTVDDIKQGIINYFNSDRDKYTQNIREKKKELSWSSFAEAVVELYKKL